MPELPQLPLPLPARVNSQPLPEAEAPAKRIKPEPEDDCSLPGAQQLQPALSVDCRGMHIAPMHAQNYSGLKHSARCLAPSLTWAW